MDKRTPSLLTRILPKIAGGTAASIILDKMLGGKDPFKTKAEFGALTPIKGLNGAEVVADQISEQLRSLGFKVNNFNQIATDARKAVDSGKSLEDAVEEAFVKARDRADIIRDDGVSGAHPKIPSPHLKINDEVKPLDKTDAGDDDLENASPENRKFMDDVLKPLKPVDEIMLKHPEDLTEGEFMELKKAMIDLPAGPEQERLDKAATGFLEHRFGTKPVKTDAVGRMIDPKPVRDIPETPKPIANADGKPLKYDLRRIGRNILKDAKSDGLAAAVKHLQGGLNILDQTPKLKEDGVFGRKSRAGLRRAVVSFGAPKVEEGLALGRFNAFAHDGQKQDFGGLAGATEKSFAPLFRNPAKPPSKPTDRIETVTLQETLNDLGRTQSGGETFKPLKLDGDIGARTTETFGRLTSALSPERVTKRFGEFLGFL